MNKAVTLSELIKKHKKDLENCNVQKDKYIATNPLYIAGISRIVLLEQVIQDLENLKENIFYPTNKEIEKETTRRIRNNGTLYGKELKGIYRLGFNEAIKWLRDSSACWL